MSTPTVGTMSTLGFIYNDMNLVMDRHFTYFFTSRRDQCKLLENIPSFEWTAMQNQNNRDKMLSEMKSAITTHFQAICDVADVITTYTEEKVEDATYTLVIAVKCTKDGKEYDLQKAVILAGNSYKLITAGRYNS